MQQLRNKLKINSGTNIPLESQQNCLKNNENNAHIKI
jgi:hypothetical protein